MGWGESGCATVRADVRMLDGRVAMDSIVGGGLAE